MTTYHKAPISIKVGDIGGVKLHLNKEIVYKLKAFIAKTREYSEK